MRSDLVRCQTRSLLPSHGMESHGYIFPLCLLSEAYNGHIIQCDRCSDMDRIPSRVIMLVVITVCIVLVFIIVIPQLFFLWLFSATVSTVWVTECYLPTSWSPYIVINFIWKLLNHGRGHCIHLLYWGVMHWIPEGVTGSRRESLDPRTHWPAGSVIPRIQWPGVNQS